MEERGEYELGEDVTELARGKATVDVGNSRTFGNPGPSSTSIESLEPDGWHPSEEVRLLRAILAELKDIRQVVWDRTESALEVAE